MKFTKPVRPEGREPSKVNDPNVDNSPSMPDRTTQIVLNNEIIPEQLLGIIKRNIQNGIFVFVYPFASEYSDAVRVINFGYCLMVYTTATGIFKYLILSHFEGDECPVTEEAHAVNSINEIERYWKIVWEKQSQV